MILAAHKLGETAGRRRARADTYIEAMGREPGSRGTFAAVAADNERELRLRAATTVREAIRLFRGLELKGELS